VIRSGKGSLEVSQGGTHLEITLPLQDHSGTTIGAVGVVFNYKEGDDKGKLQKVAEQIRDAWRAQISNKDSLFEPAK
jgi:hypothetical protein